MHILFKEIDARTVTSNVAIQDELSEQNQHQT